MTYSVEKGSLFEDFDEVMQPLKEHHDKYQPHANLPPFELDVPAILSLELAGYFFSNKVLVDGKVEGFIGSCITPNIHYKGTVNAHVNVIYVNPNLGRLRISIIKDLIAAHEEYAKEYKVDYLDIGASPIINITPLLNKLGYVQVEVTSTKRLI